MKRFALLWPHALWLSLFLLFSTLYFTMENKGFTQGGLVHSDGIYYYYYLRSMAYDGDIHFANEIEKKGNFLGVPITPKGRPGNFHSIGPAVFWSPFFLVAHGLDTLLRDPAKDGPADGFDAFHQKGTFFGSVFYGTAAIWLAFVFLRRFFSRGEAMGGAVACALASPLVWYTVWQPCYSHALSAFVIAAFVTYWHGTRASRTTKQWIILGLLGGAMPLVRAQDMGFLALAAWDGLVALRPYLSRARLPQLHRAGLPQNPGGGIRPWLRYSLWVQMALFLLAVTVAFSPQMIAWKVLYGSFLTIPQTPGFMRWSSSQWMSVLFSSRHGLFTWTPLLLFSVMGLVGFFRRDRRMAALLLAVLAFQVFVNGAVFDWWAGWSFGMRRMVNSYILFALGTSMVIAFVRASVAKRPLAWASGGLVALAILFGAVNFQFMKDFRTEAHPPDDIFPFREVYRRITASLIDGLYDVTGNPFSWPANLIFAARYGTSPERYDLLEGAYFLRGPGKHTLDFGHPRITPFLLDGFGPPQRHLNRTLAFATAQEATLLFPFIRTGLLEGELIVAGLEEDQPLKVEVNGHLIYEGSIQKGWQIIHMDIPQSTIIFGHNLFRFTHGRLRPWRSVPRSLRRELMGQEIQAPVRVMTRAGGHTFGEGCGIEVNGKFEVGGYEDLHMVAINPEGGRVEGVYHYPVGNTPDTAGVLVGDIQGLREGFIAALVLCDGVTEWADEAVTRELRTLGVSLDLRGKTLRGWAAIGVKGAPEGSALEALASQAPVSLTLEPWAGDEARAAAYDTFSVRFVRYE